MSVTPKIRNGTPHFSSPNLCLSCRNAQIMRGEGVDTEIVLCHNRGMENTVIRQKITFCNEYEDRNSPSMWQMEKIAWRIDVDRHSRFIGLLDPKKFREKHPDED